MLKWEYIEKVGIQREGGNTERRWEYRKKLGIQREYKRKRREGENT
jgi:hypothetical protein